jgi:hypothetical protein
MGKIPEDIGGRSLSDWGGGGWLLDKWQAFLSVVGSNHFYIVRLCHLLGAFLFGLCVGVSFFEALVHISIGI